MVDKYRKTSKKYPPRMAAAKPAATALCAAILIFALGGCGKSEGGGNIKHAKTHDLPDYLTTNNIAALADNSGFSPAGASAPQYGAGFQPEAQIISNSNEHAALPQNLLSDDLYGFSFMLDGFVYTLPAPLWHFTENGWAYSENPAEVIKPNEFAEVLLEKNDFTVLVKIANTTQSPLALAQCTAAGLTFAQNGGENLLVLPKEITLGSPRKDVLQAFGCPDNAGTAQTAPKINYTAGRNARWQFGFSINGRLETADIWCLYPKALPILPDDLPPEALRYNAPEALGESWEGYSILYADELYTLPAPVSAFLSNGWVLRDEGVLQPNRWVMRICLQKGNQILRTTLHNYSQTPQPLAACFVTMVEWAQNAADIPLALPGGVDYTSTYAEITAAYGPPHLIDTSGMNTWDIFYNAQDGAGQLVCRFSKKDDTIADLELWYHPDEYPY